MAAMIVEDFIKPIHLKCFKYICPESKALFYAKVVVIISSIFSIVAALSIRHTTSIAQVVIVVKLCSSSPLLALFTLGMFVHFCNAKGAIIGFLSSLILSIWVASGTPKPPPQRLPTSIENCNYSDLSNLVNSSLSNSTLSQVPNNQDYFIFYEMSFMWYSLFGFIPCIVIGIIVSLITNSERRFNSDNFELLTPPLANYLYKTRLKQNQYGINMVEMTEKDETGDASTVMLK
ncbi:putative sodium-dependent multivitamin transporter [Lycorma delicatula]|uniref:putative sodium-dependent multivitamin transporter n=1 Tax=Lycorma delicatula TaxID=130591 RepID=UPI003F515610